MKRVLIVSPHFPPINAPDMQRVRTALPHLRDLGWDPTVLAVEPAMVEGGVMEPELEATYPPDIRVLRVRGISAARTRPLGIGNLWWRCGRALAAAGDRLLREEHFDLAFFSTTQFSAFALGPRWRRRHALPYVLDYQDPWFTDYYRRTGNPPPGARLRFAFSQWLAGRQEPEVLRRAAAVVSVSTGYVETLRRRYPWFAATPAECVPFGFAPEDFDLARRHPPARSLVPFGDGDVHHVYVGRCGADMATALATLFGALRIHLTGQPERAARLRLHFIGTDYAPPHLRRAWVMPLARAAGVADHVREHPARIPYFEALWYLQQADGILGLGSDAPDYQPSKLLPILHAGKPTLMIYHRDGPALRFARQMNAGMTFGFADSSTIDERADEIAEQWFQDDNWRRARSAEPSALEPWSAAALTRRLTALFDRACAT